MGKDLLRRRRRTVYDGPWLPSPAETTETGLRGEDDPKEPSADLRYNMLESVTFAFLIALEALSPLQRATLLLRDVFDYSVRETAQAIGLSEANVRTTHHRARRAIAAYDRERRPRASPIDARVQQSLAAFVVAIERRDVEALERLLAASARAVSDAGGEFTSARKPVMGRSEVARLYIGLSALIPAGGLFEIRTMNGLPALVAEVPPFGERFARRWVSRCEIDAEGQIIEVQSVLATRKLTAVTFEGMLGRKPSGDSIGA